MNFDQFKRPALTTLLGHQLDNGSWFNDPIGTISSIEVLLEEVSGPDPVCESSRLNRALHSGAPSRVALWPWGAQSRAERFQYHDRAIDDAYLDAIHHAMWSWQPAGRLNQTTAWVASRWHRIVRLADPDFWLRFLDLAGELKVFKAEEPWLIAMIGQAGLHSDFDFNYYEPTDPVDRPDVVHRIRELLQRVRNDHWESRTVTAEETTAIVGAFLFHECTLFLQRSANSGAELSSLRSQVLDWLLLKQSPSGSWSDSPHVTAHCLKLLDSTLQSLQPDQPYWGRCLTAIQTGIEHLVQPETQSAWAPLRDYQQIDIFGALLRLSKRPAPIGTIFDTLDIDGSQFGPEVFISYGGPDAEFAKNLARDFEAGGLRVWFAGWDLDYGDDIVQEIERGLGTTTKFVIVLSPESIQRPWVKKELSSAFHQAIDGPGKLTVPLMYRPCKPPPFLAANRSVDFTDGERYPNQVADLIRRLKGRKRART